MKTGPLLSPRRSYRGITALILMIMVSALWLFRQSLMPVILDQTQPIIAWGNRYLNPGSFWFAWQEEHRDAQVRQLEAQNLRLYNQLAAIGRIAEENQELRALLALKAPASFQKITAEVVLRAPHQWYETLTINKGFEEGLAVNQVALSGKGVVGKVIEVTARTARIQLISHPDSLVSCLTGKNQTPGVLSGRYRSQPAHLRYLQNFAQLHSGDPVVTSGLGGVYPAGLILGKVLTLRKKAAMPTPEATVELSALQDPLQFVVVLVPDLDNTLDNALESPSESQTEAP